MPLHSGDTFAGYRILRMLGSGGMGEVYLAQHPRLPRHDALKILPSQVSADEEFRRRFEREADLASALWHPHIVGVHDRGEAEGQLWISMDYVDGLDASRFLAKHYPSGMPVDEAVEIVTAVASALDYAHKQGLVHRDVKPANIMLTHPANDGGGEQRILLTDFGIARNVGDISGLTATNMTVGTVAYAAPEQLMGDVLDGRADQYALAATAYHLITGTQLFPHSNPAVVISRHLNATPPAMADSRPELAGLDPVLAMALAKDPNVRFSSCSAFARALTMQVSGGAASPVAMTRPAAGQSRSTQWPLSPPKNDGSTQLPVREPARKRAAVYSVVVALIAVVGAIALHLWGTSRHATPTALSPSPIAEPPSTGNSAPPPTTSPPRVSPTPTTSIPTQNCGVDLTAPAIRHATQVVEPISMYPLNPDHAWGNFNRCADLSVALVPTADGTGSSPIQALMFHYGEYVGSPTGAGEAFLGFDSDRTTDSMVVLNFIVDYGSCTGCDDKTWTDVRFQLKNGQLVALDPIPQRRPG
ncbi:protein kinase domain-containing protein [Mycolicibacter arupensis]|uniref:protein kinase domain-containing protein n=1 Tax=Mycolicibacter arupensis TaxID=342002 RepID=UPI00122D138D|nr:protein kinase [Mycolicibacter arupensis]KAA1431316.1 protein kinase [Mycolicibacter arupensis]